MSPYLNNYVLGDKDFNYCISGLLWYTRPPFLKMAVVKTSVTMSQILRHIEQFCSRCWIAWWIAMSTVLLLTFINLYIIAIF